MGWEWYDTSVPWKPYTPPSVKFETEPTLVVCEFLFISLSVLLLLHALAHDRQHLFVWVGSLVSGTANDIFFMVLPFVDNFFHAQCCFMITPRLPLYIPCAYVCFMYVAVVAGWRWGWGKKRPPRRGWEGGESMGNRVERSIVSGLGSGVFYCLFDLTGAKFLWWSWHDTDAAIEARWLGVPLGSTLWTIVHVFTFSLLVHTFILTNPPPPSSSSAPKPSLTWERFMAAILGVAVLNTPLMMLFLTPFQLHQLRFSLKPFFHLTQLPGKPDLISLILVLVLSCLFLAYRKYRRSKQSQRTFTSSLPYTTFSPVPFWDRVLLYAIYGYIITLFLVMCLAEPGDVIAEGIHQPIGECYIKEYDLSQYPRFKYLCPKDFEEDFDFHCVSQDYSQSPPVVDSWFTICGKAHTNYVKFLGFLGGLGGVCMVFFTCLLNEKKKRGIGEISTKSK